MRACLGSAYHSGHPAVPSGATQELRRVARPLTRHRYGTPASLAGIPIGHGDWIIDIGKDGYTGIATGRLSGILRLLAKGQGSSVARGAVRHDRLLPASFRVHVITDYDRYDTCMALHGGNVTKLASDPELNPNQRFTLSLSFKRIDQVKITGYEGNVLSTVEAWL
jgi:hypothetical protein